MIYQELGIFQPVSICQLDYSFIYKHQMTSNIKLQEVPELFQHFIQSLQCSNQIHNVWDWADKLCHPKEIQNIQISIKNLALQYRKIKNKYTLGLIRQSENEWHKNQKKLYLQILIFYSKQKSTLPIQLDSSDWQFLSNIFFDKNPMLLKFQAFDIFHQDKKVYWKEDDDLLIQEFIQDYGESRWNEISKMIFYKTKGQKFFTAKQIRQRWNNHVNNNLKKTAWTTQQDEILLNHVLQKNKRWSEITKLFNKSRNEHMIKNRFKILIGKYERRKLNKPSKIKQLVKQVLQRQQKKNAESKIGKKRRQKIKQVQKSSVSSEQIRNHQLPMNQMQQNKENSIQHQNIDKNLNPTASNIENFCQQPTLFMIFPNISNPFFQNISLSCQNFYQPQPLIAFSYLQNQSYYNQQQQNL